MRIGNDQILEQLLCSRFEFQQVRHEQFASGYSAEIQIVPSCRFLLFLKGKIEYKAENRNVICVPGSAVFVPPWVCRTWRVVSEEPAELLWTVFTCREFAFDDIIIDQPRDFKLLTAALKRMFAIWRRTRDDRLLLEGELKATLARFLTTAPRPEIHELGSERHPEVEQAVRWLHSHYHMPAALSDLQQRLTLNPHYFRELFRKQVHYRPNQYLTMLRMRAARYFLMETTMSLKEIAGQIGYLDPLYFSRTYRRFWGCAPSRERG